MDADALPDRRMPAGPRRSLPRRGTDRRWVRARLARVLLLPVIAAIRLAAGAARLARAVAGVARRTAAPGRRLAGWWLAWVVGGAFVAGATAGAWLGFRLAPAPEATPKSAAGVSAPAGRALPEAALAADAAVDAGAEPSAATAAGPASPAAPAGTAAGRRDAVPAETAAAEPPMRPAPGSLTWPVRGEVLVPFGWVYSRVHGDWRFHPGIDIRSAPDMPFVAALGGTVADVRHTAGDGYTLVLSHGRGVETLYAGLRAVAVRPGEPVRAGQEVGRVGPGPAAETGAGAHLHFEVRVGGEAVDPLPLLPAR